MNILHFTAIGTNVYSGIFVVVPQHVRAQEKIENVAVVNIQNIKLDNVANQFDYTPRFKLEDLPKPFARPDIVVFHGIYIPQYLTVYKELVKAGIPYIVVPHGSLTKEALSKKRLKKFISNILFFNSFIKHSSAIHYLSEREATASPYKHKFFVCGNGITLPNTEEKGLTSNGLKFAYIGRLDPYHKGLDLMLEAIALQKNLLKENHCEFDIYGPNLENQFEKVQSLIAKNDVGDIVALHSGVIGAEKEKVLKRTDIFIQTSRFEGMPMGILEALSYGLPCLVTKGTTMGEYISEYGAGWTVETDVKSIASGLEKAVSSRNNCALFGANAKRLIENNFTWEKIGEDTISFYRKILLGKSLFQ